MKTTIQQEKLFNIVCRQTGTVIESRLTAEESDEMLCQFEQDDRYNDCYVADFYQIVPSTTMDEHLENIEALTRFTDNIDPVSKITKAYQYAKEVVMNPDRKVYTCHTSGSGRFTSNLDYTFATKKLLERAGVHFKLGNDSPRGGLTGNFIHFSY